MVEERKRKSCHSDHYLAYPKQASPTVSPTVIRGPDMLQAPHAGDLSRQGGCRGLRDNRRVKLAHCPLWYVSFTPKSGHVQCNSVCPLCANSGHSALAILS